MTHELRLLAGILLIVLPSVMIGGVSILSLLIGDQTYMENPLRQDLWRAGHAHAVMDAFHDAEICAVALDRVFSGAQPFNAAMSEYQRARCTGEGNVRIHLHASDAGTTATRNAAALWRGSRQPEGHGRVRTDECRDNITCRVFRAGERQCDYGRRLGRPSRVMCALGRRV